ncbi:hypothetical protein lerEdw1_015005 [Lerista edwardsae]|nr:hypothetical protein lerEdw1_015005 [Lerista edwardsae]
MCGIMDSPVTDGVQNDQIPLQIDSTPDYLSEIHLPSISSGSSGSGSSSPFTVQQIDKPRLIFTDNGSGPTFNIEDEEAAPISEKFGDIYSINNYENAKIVRNATRIHSELTDRVENIGLKFEGSSSSSSSSEADAEEADAENGSELPRTQSDLVLGRKDEAKSDGSLPSYPAQQALVQNHTNKHQGLSTSLQDHIYPSCFGSTADWKSSKFLSIWGSEVMNEKDWNASTFLQNTLPCEVTTEDLSNFSFSYLGDVFHSHNSEDHRCCSSPGLQSNPTSLAPLSSLSPVVLSPASSPHLPSSNAPSFSRVTTTAPGFVDPHSSLYPTTIVPPSATESLISAPSSVCSDPDCEGHHCENSNLYDHPQYDGEESQDEDSCSEHSSGTSTSTNQKEGKYCDCCYCEFFGHGGPPAAPTSRNYAEMREKLRLRLTKRKEEQPKKPELISDRENVIDHRKVEDLLQFINSPETKPVSRTRAAKRARHKQKKMKEKASIEMEAGEGEHHQPLEQQPEEDEEGQQLQELQIMKEKKKERSTTNYQKAKVLPRNGEVMTKPSPNTPENIQNEVLEQTEASADLISTTEEGETAVDFCDPCIPINARDSNLLFKTDMTVKSQEPLSLLLNIMHNHTEDKNKEKITQIRKLFAQELKKPSKATSNQPKINKEMQSKTKVEEIQTLAISKKEKRSNNDNTKQMHPVPEPPFVSSSPSSSDQQHKTILQDVPLPKGKNKKNKKKKGDKGNSSIDDVFLPKDVDLDNVDMDETEREVEYFKR